MNNQLCIKMGAIVLLLAAVTVASGFDESDLWCVYPGGDGPGKDKHIVLIAGDEEYRSEEALPMLGKLLSQKHGFKCTVLFPINPETGEIDPNNQNNIPGMEEIANADLVIMALRFRQLPDEQMKHFVDFFEAGGPVIGLRTSTHAFRYPKDSKSKYRHYSFNSSTWKGGFGQQVLGDTWISHHGHHGSQSTRGVIDAGNKDSVLLQGVKDVWGPTDVYGIRNLGEDAKVLLHGQVVDGMNPADDASEDGKNDPMMPVAWIRSYPHDNKNVSRIFCSTMGASQDFESEGLRRLVVNASYWCVGLEAEVNANLDVGIVDEYKPTKFGFNKFQKGVKPADHDLQK